MATQALIEINGTAGSNTDLPLDVLVNLTNAGAGGETTWEWTLLSQPEGTQDSFVDSGTLVSALAAPQFTPTKEGSYLIRLIVNKGLVDEKTDTVIGAVLELQTGNRIPAALETTEVDNTYGWSYSAVNDILQRVTRLTDAGTFVCIAGENLAPGDVVHMTEMTTIAAGLPGERKLPTVMKASAATLLEVDGPLGVMVGQKSGDYLSVTTGEFCRVMTMGGLSQISLAGGTGVAGDPIYVDNAGALSLTPGTYIRQVADVAKVYPGPFYDVSVAAVANSIPRGNASGDLSGYYPDPTVAKVNGTTVTTAGGGAGGAVLRMTGAATADWGAVDLADTDAVTGVLPIARGGTNGSATPTAGGVAYGTGTAYAMTAAGTSGYLLASNGAAAPSWLQTVPPANGGTGITTVPAAGVILYGNGTTYSQLAAGTAGYLLKSNGAAAPSWLQTVPPSNGGTGNATVPGAGVILYGNGTTYSQLTAGTTDQILRGGSAPSWGTVPTAAFATSSIPASAMISGIYAQVVTGTYTNTTTTYTPVAQVVCTLTSGSVFFTIAPHENAGTEFYNRITTASNTTVSNVYIKAEIVGPSGFSKTLIQRFAFAQAHNNNQISGSITFPMWSFLATVDGSYTVTISAKVSIAGDSFQSTDYRLYVQQG